MIENKVSDLTIKYKVDIFEKIENTMGKGDAIYTHFMLALLGFHYGKRIDLSRIHGDKSREFSIRTIHQRSFVELEAQYGLLAILDNYSKSYEEVVNDIAFERTGTNNKSFYEMKNVRTFYEYMLGGIDVFEEKIGKVYGWTDNQISDSIYEFLDNDLLDQDLINEMIKEEEILDV